MFSDSAIKIISWIFRHTAMTQLNSYQISATMFSMMFYRLVLIWTNVFLSNSGYASITSLQVQLFPFCHCFFRTLLILDNCRYHTWWTKYYLPPSSYTPTPTPICFLSKSWYTVQFDSYNGFLTNFILRQCHISVAISRYVCWTQWRTIRSQIKKSMAIWNLQWFYICYFVNHIYWNWSGYLNTISYNF